MIILPELKKLYMRAGGEKDKKINQIEGRFLTFYQIQLY